MSADPVPPNWRHIAIAQLRTIPGCVRDGEAALVTGRDDGVRHAAEEINTLMLCARSAFDALTRAYPNITLRVPESPEFVRGADAMARVVSETYGDLTEAVKKMRLCQRAYFKTRSREDLIASKDAEREVDRLLAELDAPAPKQGGVG